MTYSHKKVNLSRYFLVILIIGELMNPIHIIIIAVIGSCIVFLSYLVIKSFVTPRRIDGIQKLLKQKKYNAAIKLAKSLSSRDPSDYTARYWLGEAYLADGKPELALMEFKFVNQNAIFGGDIAEIPFRKNLAELYSRFNHTEDAFKQYILLTKLEPANAENFFKVGKYFEQKGKSDQALGYYQQTIKLNKRHVKAHAAYGLLLFRAKQYSEAKKEIDYAIQLSPDTFSSYYYLGKILKENKDYAAAVAAFEKSLRDPEYKQKALIERGSCYMAANNIEKAMVEYDRAVKSAQNESSQETLYARYFLAACYEKTRKLELAISQWEAIYAKNHNFKDVASKLAQYKDLQSNDHMKEYLTSNPQTFNEICKKVALSGFGLTAGNVESKKFGCMMVATESKNENWMNMRQSPYLLVFYREPDLIEDSVLRKLLEIAKSKSYVKVIIFSSAGFTRTAISFSENRPVELINKDKLEVLLSKADI